MVMHSKTSITKVAAAAATARVPWSVDADNRRNAKRSHSIVGHTAPNSTVVDDSAAVIR